MSGKLVARAALCCVSALLVTGCGRSDLPELGTVSGTVTLDGQPLADAIVNFTPVQAGRPSTGQTDSSGHYTLLYVADVEGAVVGKHSVTVERIVTSEADDLPEDPADLEEGQVMIEPLPDGAIDGSIVKEVKAGDNAIDVAISAGS